MALLAVVLLIIGGLTSIFTNEHTRSGTQKFLCYLGYLGWVLLIASFYSGKYI